MSSHKAFAHSPVSRNGSPAVARERDAVLAYLEDAAHYPGGRASGVAHPSSTTEVAELLRRAGRVLPIGAQSSLTGGATPMGELVITTQRLDRIIRFTKTEVTAQAGVPVSVLQEALGRRNVYYPPVPTFEGAFVGGVAATNAAGAATFKYGTTREWIRGLTVVLADGSVLELVRDDCRAHPEGFFELHSDSGITRVPVPSYRMPDVPKRSAGYFADPEMDLIDLFVGSEGTLGIITEVTCAVVSPAPEVCLVWIPLADEPTALALVTTLRDETRATWRSHDPRALDVAAVEYLDRRSLELVQEDGADREWGVSIPDDAVVALLVQIELPHDAALTPAAAYEQIGIALTSDAPDTPLVRLCRVLSDAGVLARAEIALPHDRRRQTQLLALREAVPEAVNRRVGVAQRDVDATISKTAADMIVPYRRFSESMALFREAFERRDLDYAIWGHISDANMHPNVIPRDRGEMTRGQDAILECGRTIIGWGGCPLAEHGVGRNPIKQALLHELYGDAGIAQMRQVKAALDPDWKLSPGVLFPQTPDVGTERTG